MARGLLIWLLIMAIETAHGMLRASWLVPHVGPEAAARIGWPAGALIVLGVALLAIRWTRLRTAPELLALGAAWAALTALFELAVGLLQGLDGPGLAATLSPWTGSIPWSAALMLVAPLLAVRLRGGG